MRNIRTNYHISYFRGVCYHLGTNKTWTISDSLEVESYCVDLSNPGRLAILPDNAEGIKALYEQMDDRISYRIGNKNRTSLEHSAILVVL